MLTNWKTSPANLRPTLDLSCIRQMDANPFYENYVKLYFDAKHLEK